MSEIDVSQLDNSQLRDEILTRGGKCGPVTPSTRKVYEKRLLQLLNSNIGVESSFEETPKPESSEATTAATSEVREKVKEEEEDPGTLSVYYAVAVPGNPQRDDYDEILVFTSREKAIRALKQYKGSRLNQFKTREEAEHFSKLRVELLKDRIEMDPNNPERSLFPSPSISDLGELRNLVEKDDIEKFTEIIWKNPRFIVSSGDTPVIYLEGNRFNLLHVCAKFNSIQVCQALLDALSNPPIFGMMYPNDSAEQTERRINFLLDMYCNTPDKFGDTPLHVACKFGHYDVAKRLCQVTLIEKEVVNTFGEKPIDIICSRCPHPSSERIESFKELLKDEFFVPLFRSDCNSSTPMIAKPYSPSRELKNPLHSPRSPRCPIMKVVALAGPTDSDKAESLYQRLKSPSSTERAIRCSDCDKGVERVARAIARDMKVPWSEYWDFLNEFVDLASERGLQLLESYLKNKYYAMCVSSGHVEPGGHQPRGSHTSLDLSELVNRLELLQVTEDPRVVIYDEDMEVKEETQTPTECALFIKGNAPTKADLNVLFATSNAHPDEKQYPFIFKWKRIIASFPTSEQQSWKTPAATPVPTPTGTPRRARNNINMQTPS